MPLLPPPARRRDPGASVAAWILGGFGLLMVGPGAIHVFLPDGGAGTIAGLDLSGSRDVVIGVFAWAGATQIAWGLAMLCVAWRVPALVPLMLALVVLERSLIALSHWWLKPPVSGHHPPGAWGTLIVIPIALIGLGISLRGSAARQTNGAAPPHPPAAPGVGGTT